MGGGRIEQKREKTHGHRQHCGACWVEGSVWGGVGGYRGMNGVVRRLDLGW